jgi:hypothetical protein
MKEVAVAEALQFKDCKLVATSIDPHHTTYGW